ncbi:hypothetical protein GCM10027300_05240 [Modestobacter lapidis]
MPGPALDAETSHLLARLPREGKRGPEVLVARGPRMADLDAGGDLDFLTSMGRAVSEDFTDSLALPAHARKRPSERMIMSTHRGSMPDGGTASRRLAAVAAPARATLPPAPVITDRAELRTYECDGPALYRVQPALVVLPETADQLSKVVRACSEQRVPFVARGSGTGLSGGALPRADGVPIVTSRMRAILELRPDAQRAVVEPGSSISTSRRPPHPTATTRHPSPRASSSARSAATSPRTLAERTASSTASPATMSPALNW